MPKKYKGDEPKDKKGDDAGKEPPKDGEQYPPPKNPDANPVRIHRDYVERRLAGGAPASPEAYARALEQWHKLPGAVSTPPTEVRGGDHERPREEGDVGQAEDKDPNNSGRP
ncbi:MAG: hypothetical protein ABI877_06995 [Gemmatimonadaceae bacterium]